MAVTITAPVGVRWNTTQVKNNAVDQTAIIDALSKIQVREGGKKDIWINEKPGPDGTCSKTLAAGILDFQRVWAKRGITMTVDGVVDPAGKTMKQINASLEEGPGKAQVFVGSDAIGKAVPELGPLARGVNSLLVELTFFDIASADLKPAHEDAIFSANLKAFDKDFDFVHGWGFHSNTGGVDNHLLATNRAKNAVKFSKFIGIIDARIKRFDFAGVDWRPGMPDGETGEMRKALILFRGARFSFDREDSSASTEPRALGMFAGATKSFPV